ncbi:hypothetical protein CNEO3_200028 [Clostridium neonatale]|nr:hypothetical protein CNEO3_170036 [Clostridium neonatale]CAI3585967.1 hypothetical protein CNEO3_10104 [Clostridium neonatale]CAI3613603.1 hypothetical protein CNEO3_200028 [Clostridium neonatale]CAI3628546.1 hypothetical protein CNEO3_280028 [Clostridium neonatale]CAI3683352.1 hypothetical protein CNEO3_90027 [Clostridium neonatale]
MVDNKEDDMFTGSAEYSDEAYAFKENFLHSVSIKSTSSSISINGLSLFIFVFSFCLNIMYLF